MNRLRAPLAFAYVAFACLCLANAPIHAGVFDCSAIYDEFDSLMNKNFLMKPGIYGPIVQGKLSRGAYNDRQKGKLMLSPNRKGWGVAVVHTNKDTWGKFLFSWGGPGDARGMPLLILRDVTLFGRVHDGHAPRVTREIRVSSSQMVDLDVGLTGEGPESDIWFHNVDGRTMYVEAVNGASLAFPMETLCRQQPARR